MSKPLENKDTPGLQEKLKSIGFEQTTFEPKTGNRFIVYLEGIPSYVIKSIILPGYDPSCDGWKKSRVTLLLYNPLEEKLEKSVLSVVRNETNTVVVKELNPVGEIDTIWTINTGMGGANFGKLDWSDKGDPNIIQLSFEVKDVTISY